MSLNSEAMWSPREIFSLEISNSAHSKVPCSPGARTMDYLSRQKRGCQGTFLYGRGRLVRKTDRNYGPIIFKIVTKYFQIFQVVGSQET